MEDQAGRLSPIVQHEPCLELFIDADGTSEVEFLSDVECGGREGHDSGHFGHGEGEQERGWDEPLIEMASDGLTVAGDVLVGWTEGEGGEHFAFVDFEEVDERLSFVHGLSVRLVG